MADTSPFEGKAEWFDREYRETTHGRVRLELVLERLHQRLPPPPAAVLDAGGGTGAFAIPLARRGYRVTVLDPSPEWLEVAARRAREERVEVGLVEGSVEDADQVLTGERFDALLCHAVLMYLPEPERALRSLRAVAGPGAVLSVLEKNREGLPMRPGLTGDYAEALRVLDDPVAAGRLGIASRSRSVGELRTLLLASGWRPAEWRGVRLFSDAVSAAPEERYPALLELERAVAVRDPYRRVAWLVHVLARPLPEPVESLEMVQARSLARAVATTRASWPPDHALSGPELDAFLTRKRYGLLATTRADGRPHAAMVGFVLREGRIWLPTVAGAVRLRNVGREPSASLVVTEGEGDEHVAVLVEGDAVVHRDAGPILSAWLLDAWRERFGTDPTWTGAVIELIPSRVLSHGAGVVVEGPGPTLET